MTQDSGLTVSPVITPTPVTNPIVQPQYQPMPVSIVLANKMKKRLQKSEHLAKEEACKSRKEEGGAGLSQKQ